MSIDTRYKEIERIVKEFGTLELSLYGKAIGIEMVKREDIILKG